MDDRVRRLFEEYATRPGDEIDVEALVATLGKRDRASRERIRQTAVTILKVRKALERASAWP